MTSPDPDPDTTPSLFGGAQLPGDTPPGESSTSGVSQRQPDLPGRLMNWAVYVVLIAVVVLACLYFVGIAVGLLG